MNKVPSSVSIAVIGFASLCVCIVGVLVWHGNDPGPLVTFIGTLIPLTIGVVIVANKVDKVQDTANDVYHNVNGKLNAQFAAIHARLDAAGIPDQRTPGRHAADESSDEGLTPAG